MKAEFNRNLELICGLCYCAYKEGIIEHTDLNNSLYACEYDEYKNDFYELYKTYANDELKNYIGNFGFGGFGNTCRIALSLDDNFNVIDDEINKLEFFNKEKAKKCLTDFVRESKFDVFYESRKGYYDNIIKLFLDVHDLQSAENLFDEFYGYTLGDKKVYIYNFQNGSCGLEINNSVVYCQKLEIIDGKFKNKMFNFFHEFSHPYIAPYAYKYLEYSDLSDWKFYVLEYGYEVIQEYIVRAIEIYLGGKLMGEDKKLERIKKQESRGFIRIKELVDTFENRNKYSNFEDFFKNEILKTLKNSKEKTI